MACCRMQCALVLVSVSRLLSLRASRAGLHTAPGNHQPVEIFKHWIHMCVDDIPLGHLELRLRVGARQPAHALGEEGAEHVPVRAPEFDYAREGDIALKHGETKLDHCNIIGWVDESERVCVLWEFVNRCPVRMSSR